MVSSRAPWKPSLLLAATLWAALMAGAAQADAYCRTSVCNGSVVGTVCEPPRADDCGIALYWTGRCVGFSVQEDASAKVPWEVADSIAVEAFDTWSRAVCDGGQGPSIEGVDLGPVECAAREYNQSGGNANLLVFRDDLWPYAGQWNTLALTTVTYNLDTGEIYDADLEINSANVDLTWSDTDVGYDLPSIVTHEVGHVLGLAHASGADATMYSDYQRTSTTLRDLAPDDIAGICAIYPPGPPRSSLPCDPTPRHGFKSDCGPGPAEEEGCSVSTATGSTSTERGWPPWAALLGWLLILRRTARRRRGARPTGP